MRSWVYIEKCSMALSQAALPARGLRKAGRLFLGYVAQFTVESRFHRAEHILNPGSPGRKGLRCYSTKFYTGRLRLVGVAGRRSPQKNFSALRVSARSKNKGKPSPGSATVYFFLDIWYIYFGRFDQEVLIIWDRPGDDIHNIYLIFISPSRSDHK